MRRCGCGGWWRGSGGKCTPFLSLLFVVGSISYNQNERRGGWPKPQGRGKGDSLRSIVAQLRAERQSFVRIASYRPARRGEGSAGERQELKRRRGVEVFAAIEHIVAIVGGNPCCSQTVECHVGVSYSFLERRISRL